MYKLIFCMEWVNECSWRAACLQHEYSMLAQNTQLEYSMLAQKVELMLQSSWVSGSILVTAFPLCLCGFTVKHDRLSKLCELISSFNIQLSSEVLDIELYKSVFQKWNLEWRIILKQRLAKGSRWTFISKFNHLETCVWQVWLLRFSSHFSKNMSVSELAILIWGKDFQSSSQTVSKCFFLLFLLKMLITRMHLSFYFFYVCFVLRELFPLLYLVHNNADACRGIFFF